MPKPSSSVGYRATRASGSNNQWKWRYPPYRSLGLLALPLSVSLRATAPHVSKFKSWCCLPAPRLWYGGRVRLFWYPFNTNTAKSMPRWLWPFSTMMEDICVKYFTANTGQLVDILRRVAQARTLSLTIFFLGIQEMIVAIKETEMSHDSERYDIGVDVWWWYRKDVWNTARITWKLKNVSGEYDLSHGRNSNLQAAWYSNVSLIYSSCKKHYAMSFARVEYLILSWTIQVGDSPGCCQDQQGGFP